MEYLTRIKDMCTIYNEKLCHILNTNNFRYSMFQLLFLTYDLYNKVEVT